MTLTPETGRIRWEDITSSIDAIASRGYVGKLERRSFIIYRPELSDGQYRLLCLIGDRGGESLYRDDPEPLKAEAERWLEEFASSLGAVFGDAVAADLRSRAEEMEGYSEGDAEGRHDRSMFATGMRRAASLIEHGDVPEPAKETGQ